MKESQPERIGVCLLATDVDMPTGGIQSISFRLLDELNRRGSRTFICSRNYENQPGDESRNGTRIHRSPTLGRFFRAFNSLSYILDGLLWLARHRREYQVIHCQQIFSPAMIGLMARSILKKPVVVGVHKSGAMGEVSDLRRMSFSNWRLRQLKTADSFAVLSQEMQEELESLGIPSEKITFIPNAIPLPTETGYAPGVRQSYRERLNLPYEKIVAFTGRLSPEKGLDTLIKAWATVHEQHPTAHLLILGEGLVEETKSDQAYRNIETELRELSAALDLDSTVHFLGFKSNPMDYLLAANAFVLPSRAEGMSCSLIEAMACGTAIVASDIRANHALCQNEMNSLVFPLDDSAALAEAITRILDDPAFEEQLARAAREKAEADLTIEVMTDRYLELYSSLKN